MKRFAVILVIIGLSLIPSVTLAEYSDLPDYIEAPIDTETIANDIPDIMGTTETVVDVPVSAPEPVVIPAVEETIECACDNPRDDIKNLYQLDDTRFDQMNENYEILVDRIEDLQGQIYELQNTTSY